MKKLNLKEAFNLIENGKAVRVQLSSRTDDDEIVHTKDRLNYLYSLSQEGTQSCVMYDISSLADIPEGTKLVTFDEAYKLLYDGELVFYLEDGEEDEITSGFELMEIQRTFKLRGQELVLYIYM